MKTIPCKNRNELSQITNNPDGTISAYVTSPSTGQLVPYILTKPCCENIGGTFDVKTQKCFYGKIINGCDYTQPFNLVLNPKGNDGAIFSSITDETCSLEVQFDYLFKFDCDKLSEFINGKTDSSCENLDEVFQNIGASMSIEKISQTQVGLTTIPIYEEVFFTPIGAGNLFDYLTQNSGNTGFYICQENNFSTTCNDLDLSDDVFVPRSNCAEFAEQMLIKYPLIPNNSFASNWLTFNTEITNQPLLSEIVDEKIKLVIKLSGFCIDMCVLVDNIKLNKKCTKTLKDEIFVTKSPGFELDRIIDNKKSWVRATETTHREFSITKTDGTQPIRYTDYYLENERQVLNTKEIDLDINIAAAVETDVWCYISDNPCLLTGGTIGTTTCTKDALQTITGTVTSTTYSTTYAVVYTACTILVKSSTTVSNPSITAYTCPVGYSATPANDQCQAVISQPATFNSTGALIGNGDTNRVYGNAGAYFYPTVNLTTSALPYRYGGSSQGFNLIDVNNNVITPVTISAPANTFWRNPPNSTLGRLNLVGLRPLDKILVNGQLTNWVGFTECLNITQSGTYYVGLAADNYCRFYVNGVLVFESLQSVTVTFNRWSVFPIQLNSGQNFITMEGLNDAGTSGSFGAEIYYPTGATPFNTLVNATSTGATEANVIFSTAQRVGTNWDNGQTVGYSCPTGFNLNFCNGGTPICSQVFTQPITLTITPVPDTVTTVIVSSATTCPGLSAVTTASYEISYTSSTACLPKTYCCSEYCGDANVNIQALLTQPLSSVTTIEDFQYYITSELIDAKNRQTINSYATLRLLYERYMNSLAFCNTQSSKFDYYKMEQFANLIGNYWVDLIEQVIPATTIWGSTRVYTNTIFDKQKHKYKAYTSLFGTPNFKDVLSPATGATCGVEVKTSVITGNTSTLPQFNQQTYSTVYLTQINSGSEFIGTVEVMGKSENNTNNFIFE